MKYRSKLLFGVMLITIVILSAVQLLVSNKLATSGTKLSLLGEEISFYREENSILHSRIIQALSLTRVAKEAKELGFVKDHSPIVVVGGQVFALR